MNRLQSWQSTALVLMVLTLVSFACKKTPPVPPPPTAAAIVPSTPAAPCAAPVIALRADSGTIVRGVATTLSWTSTNAATVDIQPGIGSVTPVAGGNRQVSPASSVTYTATVTGPCGTAADTLRVTVNEPPAPTPPTPPRGGDPVPPRDRGPILTSQQIFDRDMQAINFDYDKSDIRDDQKGKLQKSADYLRTNPGVRVTIEGHADERGSAEYNLALGDRRANAVKQNLMSQGIAENRLSSVSYGEERPVCSQQSEDCYTQNRRAAYKNQ